MKKILVLSLALFAGLALNSLSAEAQETLDLTQNCSQYEQYFNTCANDCIAQDPQCDTGSTGPCGSQLNELWSCQDQTNTGDETSEGDESNASSEENGSSGSGSNSSSGSSSGGSAQYDKKYLDPTKPVFNGPGLIKGATYVEGRLDKGVSKERNLKELIIGWTNFLTSIAALMAVVAIVWAGFLYITAFGEESRMDTAKKIVIWVVIGILVILAAYAIVNTVISAVF